MLIWLLNGSAVVGMLFFILRAPIKEEPTGPYEVLSKYYSLIIPQNLFERLYRRYFRQTYLSRYVTQAQIKVATIAYLMAFLIFWMASPWQSALKIGVVLTGIFLPFAVLELRLEHIERKIDAGLFSFLSKLNARLIQNQDLMQVLQLVESEIGNPYIETGIHHFNRSVRAGLSPEIAFDLLKGDVHHEHLRYIYLNIEQAYLKRGDVSALMRALENEYTSIQVELNKRKIELQTERNFVFLSLLFVGASAVGIARSNDFILQYYRTNAVGQAVMIWLILGIFLGLFLLIYASKVRE
jgi:hypothetical protein